MSRLLCGLALALGLGAPAHAGALDKALQRSGKAAAPAPGGVFWFNPAETLITRGQLYFSAYASDLRLGQKVAVHLEGAGAPAEAVASYTANKDGANFAYRWLSFTDGALGTNAPGLPIARLKAGAYRLKMTVDGAEERVPGISSYHLLVTTNANC